MRYDSIWLSDHFTVQSIDYHYDDTPGALSDHAAVHAVITL